MRRESKLDKCDSNKDGSTPKAGGTMDGDGYRFLDVGDNGIVIRSRSSNKLRRASNREVEASVRGGIRGRGGEGGSKGRSVIEDGGRDGAIIGDGWGGEV